MTALAANRNTPELAGINPVALFTILNAAVCYAGGIAAIDYTGEVQPAADTAGLKVVGRFAKYVSNTPDGQSVAVERGIFRFENDTTSPVTRAAIGMPCYVVDDQTVAGKTTNYVPAGIVVDVDSDGVWVDQTPGAMARAWRAKPDKFVSKADDYAVTPAIAFEGRTIFQCDKASLMTITLPSAVAGMRVGVQRTAATAAHDVAVQAAAGDKVLGSAAAKKVDNTVDAVSGILLVEAADATDWIAANPLPADLASWVVNDG